MCYSLLMCYSSILDMEEKVKIFEGSSDRSIWEKADEVIKSWPHWLSDRLNWPMFYLLIWLERVNTERCFLVVSHLKEAIGIREPRLWDLVVKKDNWPANKVNAMWQLAKNFQIWETQGRLVLESSYSRCHLGNLTYISFNVCVLVFEYMLEK